MVISTYSVYKYGIEVRSKEGREQMRMKYDAKNR